MVDGLPYRRTLGRTLKTLTAAAPLAALLFSCASAPARHVQDGARPAPRHWAIGFDAKEYERSDLDDADGNVAVSRYAVRAEHKWFLDERTGWKLRFRQEQSEYDFGRNLGELSGLKDVDDFAETSLGASYWSAPRDGPSWFALLNVSSGVADGGDFDDGLFLKTFFGALWTVNESLNLGVGVFGRTELEDDPSVFAIPLVDWRIDDRNTIGSVQSVDPGLGYTRKLQESLDLYVSLQFLSRQYRLDDDDVDDGALLDKEQSLRLGLLFDEGNGVKIEVFTGIARRELFLNADDDEIGDDEVDAGGVFGFSASYSF